MGLTFSLLYLDQYRTINKKIISFDHRYSFVVKEDQGLISRNHQECPAGVCFYGPKIRAMSCFVGRNGEGKTSLIEFLHESFILILKKAVDKDTVFEEDGRLLVSGEELRSYHLEETTRFLVIFRVDKTDYYVTNMNGIKGPTCCRNIKDAGMMECPKFKFAWFSVKIFPSDVYKSELSIARREDGGLDVMSSEEMRQNYIIDLSEEAMDEMRSVDPDKTRLNWDVLMQTAFYAGAGESLLKEILGDVDFERIQVESDQFGGKVFTIKELISEAEKGQTPNLERVITDPRAYLRPFSSGQYSRFSFLARLYWCLGGGSVFYKSKVGKEMKGILEETDELWQNRYMFDSFETPVLLMDESDLYYHPEWQRSNIKDILKMVDECTKNDVQIIFTTNSAFMLSDMLKEDVVVLSPEGGESKLDDRTFGQNIHMLLARPFFMNSTIGASAEETIRWLLNLLKLNNEKAIEKKVKEKYSAWFEAYKAENKKDYSADEFVKRLIDSIGEELIRHRLIFLYEEYIKKRRSENDNLKNALDYLEPMKEENENIKKAIEEIKKAKGGT